MSEYFRRDVFPVLTPQAIDRARRFPHISNESLNLLVKLESRGSSRYARIKIPGVLPRLVRVPLGENEPDDRNVTFVWLEDLISANLDVLFPGHDVVVSYPFHVTRDADIEIDEDEEEAHDLLAMMQEMLSERTFGSVVRIAVSDSMEAGNPELAVDPAGSQPEGTLCRFRTTGAGRTTRAPQTQPARSKYPPLKQALLVGPGRR